MAARVTNIAKKRPRLASGCSDITESRIKAALLNHGGNLLTAAHTLGISRESLKDRVKQSCELQQALQDGRERFDDLAKSKFFDEIKRGNPQAIVRYAEYQMRSGGYGARGQSDVRDSTNPEDRASRSDESERMIAVLQDLAELKARGVDITGLTRPTPNEQARRRELIARLPLRTSNAPVNECRDSAPPVRQSNRIREIWLSQRYPWAPPAPESWE